MLGICRNARRQHVRPADPLQPRRDLGVTQIRMITAVAADDLVRAGPAGPAVIRHPDQLPPQARCPAMAGLPSPGQRHPSLGVNAHPRITVMTPAPHADALRTASRPDIGHHMRSLGAQLNPTSVDSAYRRGLEQHNAIRQYPRQSTAAANARPEPDPRGRHQQHVGGLILVVPAASAQPALHSRHTAGGPIAASTAS
jgi:hypothetical protein